MNSGRLLVLDDDAAVGQILVMGAQTAGLAAQLCLDAAAFFAQLGPWSPTHVAIDLTMPDITSTEVLHRLAASGCRAQLIVCSGADPHEINTALAEACALGLGTAQVLRKPFTLSALRQLIAQPPGPLAEAQRISNST